MSAFTLTQVSEPMPVKGSVSMGSSQCGALQSCSQLCSNNRRKALHDLLTVSFESSTYGDLVHELSSPLEDDTWVPHNSVNL